MSVEKWWNEICGRGKREKPREKPTQTSFRPPRNPHGVTETRTRESGPPLAPRGRHCERKITRFLGTNLKSDPKIAIKLSQPKSLD